MQPHELLTITDLVSEDVKSADPKALGVIVVVLHLDPDGDMGVQVGADVPPAIAQMAFRQLARLQPDGSDYAFARFAKPRKVV